MNEYMLIYKGGDPKWLENTSPEDMAAAMEKWTIWMEELQSRDRLVTGGAPLQYSGKNITNDGVVTDISTAEFKELVTGYSIVKAATIEEATQIAKACPIFNSPGTTLDIRPIQAMG